MAAGEVQGRPKIIFLFSGKRKSGKDYITDTIYNRIGLEKCVIIRLSGPIKKHWAQAKSLQFDELLSDGQMKEQYRKAMIDWSDEIRSKDPSYFCRLAVEMYDPNHTKDIWVISDARRKTDIAWFKSNFSNVKTIRIEAKECTRKKRGWNYSLGVDDISSECDLDQVTDWNWIIQNDKDDDCRCCVDEIVNYAQRI
ncbi:phosphomevalonate kinase [Adelges cooleyi]|uniref:phosphomevalonate kinase n=1 Tax=Adelges cooleyi TaxID=133065 RepID=UPI00217FC92C|nr:phosphomevalonate kinase [Adelges cooleyi]